MCFAFKDSRNNKGILKKELKERYNKYLESLGFRERKASEKTEEIEDSHSDHHHHHHHDEEIDHLHDHDKEKCIVCTKPQ